MKITIGNLRRIIRNSLREAGGGQPRKKQPYIRNAMAPDIVDREALGRLETGDQEEDELPPHLREPEVDAEDCWGPVPPTAEDPYVTQDPYVRFSSPLPTPQIKR
jgi:hypothetical protein